MKHWYLETGPIAGRVSLLNLRNILVALLVLAVLVVWALGLGSYRLGLSSILNGIFLGSEAPASFIVREIRLPRALSAVFVGSALGMAGAIFQSVIRNPLASPDVIGIQSGAGTAGVFWLITGMPIALLPAAAGLGAGAAAAAIAVLSVRRRVDPERLVLVGIGINALLDAFRAFLLLKGSVHEVSRAYRWMVGSLYTASWTEVQLAASVVLFSLLALPFLSRRLRLLQLGDEAAQGIGLAVGPSRSLGIVLGVLLGATAVAAAGPIGFVALVSPHLARMFGTRFSYGYFVLSGLLGSILLLTADLVALHGPVAGLPVGVVTAALGAPYFLFLLVRLKGRNLA